MKHRVSEVFGPTIQGEGGRTGILSVWIRTFGCNLECNGFMQQDPTNPSTYVLPYQSVDVASITRMEDLPVFEYGCDSSYSWSAKYKHLAHDYTTNELVDKVYSLLPGGRFVHPVTEQTYDLCLTGGEPMMQQAQLVALLNEMIARNNYPTNVQIETNGTRTISPQLTQFLVEHCSGETPEINWYWSVSPKLWNVAGESSERAWKPGVIAEYFKVVSNGWIKFVVNGKQATWDELAGKVAELNAATADSDVLPIYCMPVGATAEQQEDRSEIEQIATRAIAEGYNISGRLHTILFGNSIGT